MNGALHVGSIVDNSKIIFAITDIVKLIIFMARPRDMLQ